MEATLDAIVIGSGPNGLSAAITIAREGYSVLVIEAGETVGGGTRSAELTLPGFVHDICSAIHPMGVASPFFRSLPLDQFGLEWIHPEILAAQPFLDGTAAGLYRSLDQTAAALGQDEQSYRKLVAPFLKNPHEFLDQILGPLRIPGHPLQMARFGLRGLHSARKLANKWFREPHSRGLYAGMAAHSVLPLDRMLTGAVGLMFLVTAHVDGWPLAKGGSHQISFAMQRYLESQGGKVITGQRVSSLKELPPAKAILFDTSPHTVIEVAGDALPSGYVKQLKTFRHGPGIFKLDWALDGPIPWLAEECRKAGTVHVGGTFEEVAAAEKAAWDGTSIEHPFVLVTQQSLYDRTRAPGNQHTGWAYCHVPNGSTDDYTERIEAQIERFAPGFRKLILARHTMTPTWMQKYNENYVGGDITGGVMDARQMFTRPSCRLRPYRTPAKQIFLCSASTPPGPGVHGMCGYFAAREALKHAIR